MFLSLLVSCRRIFMTFSGVGCVTSKKLFESIMHKVSSSSDGMDEPRTNPGKGNSEEAH